MGAGVDRSIEDVEVETIFVGEVLIRPGPAVFAFDYCTQVERLFLLMAGDAIALEDRLHKADEVERVRAVHVGLDRRRRPTQGERNGLLPLRGAVARLVATLARELVKTVVIRNEKSFA